MKVHDLSGHFPILSFGEDLEIQTYFIVISLVLCLCVLWTVRRTSRLGLGRNAALDIFLVVMIFGFLGARLFHVIFEEPKYYLESPFRIFEIWRGGFVWYGGVILGAFAGVATVRYKKLPLRTWLDFFAPIAALGYGLGRIACFLAGCCYGAVCVLSDGSKIRHPTQLYAVAWELAVVVALLRLENRSLRPGSVFAAWVVLHSIGRVIMEHFRADPRGPEPLGLSLATWISGILIAIVAGSWLSRRKA